MGIRDSRDTVGPFLFVPIHGRSFPSLAWASSRYFSLVMRGLGVKGEMGEGHREERLVRTVPAASPKATLNKHIIWGKTVLTVCRCNLPVLNPCPPPPLGLWALHYKSLPTEILSPCSWQGQLFPPFLWCILCGTGSKSQPGCFRAPGLGTELSV